MSQKIKSVRLLSCVQLFATPGTGALQASLSFTISQSLLKLMSTESVMLSNHLILFGPLLLLPSIFPSIRAFSNESALQIRWWKYWSFSTSPTNEYSGLISFRIDWFDLPAVQGTLKSLFQHQSSKASVPWCIYFLELWYSREGLPFFPSDEVLTRRHESMKPGSWWCFVSGSTCCDHWLAVFYTWIS